MSVIVDVHPSDPAYGTTLASSLFGLMPTVDRPQWSVARLQGVLGHAFQFEMKEDGGEVYHDNLDWGIAHRNIKKLAKFRAYQANKDKDIDLPALKAEARDAALSSLQKGITAVVWQPMSVEQKADGSHAYCWGLIVGYDEEEETYTIRHPFVKDQYTVRYDAIGHADPVEWFNVTVFDGHVDGDEKVIHLQAIEDAIRFANGTRYSDANFLRENGKKVRPYGFAAYETWSKALDSDDVSVKFSSWHADMLKTRRQLAGNYMSELADVFPEASAALEAAAAEYNRELESLVPLHTLLVSARESETFTAEQRADAQGLIGGALNADRTAIAHVEAALAILKH